MQELIELDKQLILVVVMMKWLLVEGQERECIPLQGGRFIFPSRGREIRSQ